MKLFILISLCFALCGCSLGVVTAPVTPATPVKRDAPLPESVKDISDELKNVRARERLLEGALDDARIESAQTKLWLGSGACFLAALVLLGIGIWTSRRILIEFAVAAAGLGGLLIFAAWLAPYALVIGISIALIVMGIAGFMLWNRQKALVQVSRAVDVVKDKLPEYRDIFRGEIDTMQDHLINHVRRHRPIAK